MKLHFWNIAFLLFFAVVASATYGWLLSTNRFVLGVPLMDFVLMALAVQRLIQLFTYDLVIAFVRDWLKEADTHTFKGTLGALLNCPWCTGLWIALFVSFFYFATPFAWYVILFLALSSLGSLIQILINLIGWTAEGKKLTVKAAKEQHKELPKN
jgi:hypothetical protein